MDKKENAPLTQIELDYQAREKRVWDAIALNTPDRVPLVCQDDYFTLEQAGITAAQAFYEPELAAKVHVEGVSKYNWDRVCLWASFPGRVGDILGMTTIKWAGRDLANHLDYQFVEKEYMLADEYDEFLKDPGDFTMRKLWPRMATELEPFAQFPSLRAMTHSYTPINDLPYMAGKPEVRRMLEKLIEAGQEYNKFEDIRWEATQAFIDRGFPVMNALEAGAHAPFDWICNYFRGMKGTMLDMYYQPDKLKAAIDLVTDPIIENAIQLATEMDEKVVGIPLHRGADPFMSNEKFGEFYWPSFKKLLLRLIDAGIIPAPYFSGKFENRLEFFQELPPGKIWGHWDVIDLKKTREMVGEIICFSGNVPGSILISGTVEQTRDYVKLLIDTFGDTGGLMIDGASAIPKESKYENVMAMTETVFDYGVY